MKKILVVVVFILSSINCFSQEQQLVFTDDTSLAVNNSSLKIRLRQDQPVKVELNSIVEKEFVSFLTGTGKAVPPLDNFALKKLGKKNKSLASQIKRIHSAYSLVQNDSKYYFAGLDSIDFSKFDDCSPKNPCKIKGQAVVIKLRSNAIADNVLILKSFEIIK